MQKILTDALGPLKFDIIYFHVGTSNLKFKYYSI